MTHAWIIAFAICTLAWTAAAQTPEPAAKLIDAKATAQAMDAGIGWLVRHQDEDGRWSASQFMRHDPKTDLCTGIGKPEQDLLVTAWATTALMTRGNTERIGPHAGVVQKAFAWLETQKQADGFLGAREAPNSVVAHALVCNVLLRRRMASPQPPTKQSLELLDALRLPDGTWPASVGGTKGDAMATYFASLACRTADSLSNTPGKTNLEPALAALEKGLLATEPSPSFEATLRCIVGYMPAKDARLSELMGTLGNNLPRWRDGPDAPRLDFLDWYWGINAVVQVRGTAWQEWCQVLQAALMVHQRTDGAHAGSWDPVDANGKDGGRVYATAVNVCSLDRAQMVFSRLDARPGAGKK